MQQAAEARFLAGQHDDDEEEEEDEDRDEDEDEEGNGKQGLQSRRRAAIADEDLQEGPSAIPTESIQDQAVSDDDEYDATPSRSTSKGTQRAANRKSRSSMGRPRGRPRKVTVVHSNREDEADDDFSAPFSRAKAEDDENDSQASGSDEEGEEDDAEDEPTSSGRRGAVRGRGRGRGRGRPRGSGTARGRKRYAQETDEDEDDDEEVAEDPADALPPFKKRHSRARGFRLVVDNGQTALQRFDSESEDEATKEASLQRGRGRGRPRGRGRGRGRPGRPRRAGLPAVRIIEDSEDEDSADDRPRPKGPPPFDEPAEVPPAEVYRAKIGGKIWTLNSDELVLPDDPDGEKKIDHLGRCLGGRQWKPASFTSSLRVDPHKVYFLAVDAARACGFRDSLTFFRSDTRLIRINLLQQEKDDLIATGRLHSQQRGRNVTFVGARNVYKIFGAKVIKNGRNVIDDYYESAARAKLEKSGKADTAGQLLPDEDPRSHEQRRRDTDRERDRTRRPPDAINHVTTDAGGRMVNTIFGDSGASPFMRSLNHPSRRMAQMRADLSEENWLIEMSRNVQGMNRELAENRLERLMKFRRWDEGVDETMKQQKLVQQQQQKEEEEATAQAAAAMEVDEADMSALDAQRAAAARVAASTKRDRAQEIYDHDGSGPVGLYDPVTNLPHFSLFTQPRKARFEKLAPRPVFADHEDLHMESKRAVLGGSKVGSGAFGVATWRTDMSLAGGPVELKQRDARTACLMAGAGGEDVNYD